MLKNAVSVIFDRRKTSSKRGYGMVELRVYLSRDCRRYISIENVSPDEWEKMDANEVYADKIKKYENVLTAMELLNVPMDIPTFNQYAGLNSDTAPSPCSPQMPMQQSMVYAQPIVMANGQIAYTMMPNYIMPQAPMPTPKQKAKDDIAKRSFIDYVKKAVEAEDLRLGTKKHKLVVVTALERYGKIKTYGDLTTAKIMDFDAWLHDGVRTDVTIYGYHKFIKKYTRQLKIADLIPYNPYDRFKVKKGKSKEREPLTEAELKVLRDVKLIDKLDRVRDLFVFAAYTGLSFADTQIFDYERMTEQLGDMVFINGERVKTGNKFFTPILEPAMKVLEKYSHQLPKISNQKANDFLHVIEEKLEFKKKLTFHVARHSFATLALAHDIPIENVARMLGHQNVKTTQIYAKVLHSTIERHAANLEKEII